jgi:hypothetical protein
MMLIWSGARLRASLVVVVFPERYGLPNWRNFRVFRLRGESTVECSITINELEVESHSLSLK